ncbi:MULTISPECIES: pimeloyl-ACP methyl ester esterase BioH [Ferrimonas]|uniref:pimeloyl-ACP methyl ester esterase BioH n=1 Tax=Ferrimonas TaxID=44011 RepID=UPI00040888DF|nr:MULTISPECIES: pimeloyl-ACP methyl ester esterase BioH [Ferrimonas]
MPLSLADPTPLSLTWQGQGHPIVLLHGWGMNAAVFAPFADLLAEQGFRVGLLDLPGFGLSPPLSDGLTVAGLAAAVIQTLDDQLSAPCTLLGWSMGGLVATEVARHQPAQVSQLVTVASSPCFEQRPQWPGIKPEVLAGFAAALELDFDGTLDRFVALQAMGSRSARQDTRLIREALSKAQRPHEAALRQGLAVLQQVDQRASLPQVCLPWLRLYGRLDALVPASGVPLVDALAPQSVSVVLPKAAHAPFISHPQETLAALKQFHC